MRCKTKNRYYSNYQQMISSTYVYKIIYFHRKLNITNYKINIEIETKYNEIYHMQTLKIAKTSTYIILQIEKSMVVMDSKLSFACACWLVSVQVFYRRVSVGSRGIFYFLSFDFSFCFLFPSACTAASMQLTKRI